MLIDWPGLPSGVLKHEVGGQLISPVPTNSTNLRSWLLLLVLLGLLLFPLAWWRLAPVNSVKPMIDYGYWVYDIEAVDFNGMETHSGTQPLSLKGRWHLLTYGYTSCPDICPMTLMTISKAISDLSKRTNGELPRLVFYTLDPKRDTPDHLKAYLDYFSNDHLAVWPSSDQSAMEFESKLGIKVKRDEAERGLKISHNANIYLINPNGQLELVLTPKQSELGNNLLSAEQIVKGILAAFESFKT